MEGTIRRFEKIAALFVILPTHNLIIKICDRKKYTLDPWLIAQMVEPVTEDPRIRGSNPAKVHH